MKMIVHCCFFTVLSLAFVACANRPEAHVSSAKTGSPTDSFRINLQLNDKGTDVANWQQFLQDKGFGLTHDNSDHIPNDHSHRPYPNQKFDEETEEATKRFQALYINGNYGIAITGKVNWATYFRALEKGMPAYPPVPNNKVHTKNFGDYFRIIMRTGDSDGGIVTGHSPAVFNDVYDWQYFLVTVGYLGAGYPTHTFGSTTVTATSLWQHDAQVATANYGKVDTNTYNKAITTTWGMDSSYKVVPHP